MLADSTIRIKIHLLVVHHSHARRGSRAQLFKYLSSSSCQHWHTDKAFVFFWPQKPNYPERSLSNLGQRRFSPLYPPDPLLFNVSPFYNQELPFRTLRLWEAKIVRGIFDWKSIVPSFSQSGSLPSITVSCIFALSCQVCSSTPPPSSLSCSLYLCWAGKGQGQRISTIYSSKQKRRLLPFNSHTVLFADFQVPGNVLPANSSKTISNSSIRRQNKISPGEKKDSILCHRFGFYYTPQLRPSQNPINW